MWVCEDYKGSWLAVVIAMGLSMCDMQLVMDLLYVHMTVQI